MQSESVHIAGGVLRRFADGRVLIEVEEGLAIGDMVRFISLLSGQPACPSEVVSRMESKDGQLIYLAKTGEKIILRPAHPLEPGDWIEKTHGPGCLRIEAIINPKDICFLNGVMEGYSDMAVLRTLDSSVGLVELLASPCFHEEIQALLLSLQKEMPLEIRAVVKGAISVFL